MFPLSSAAASVIGGAGGNGLTLGNSYNDSTRKPRNSSFKITAADDGKHKHTVSATGDTNTTGEHDHRIGDPGKVDGSKSDGRFWPSTGGKSRTSKEGDHKHTVSVSGNTNNNGEHNHDISTSDWDSRTRPHAYAVNYIIKHD